MKQKLSNTIFRVVFILFMLLSLVGPAQGPVYAADSSLTITPITWNVIGLDSNDVSVGPNDFPIGVRICNPTSSDVTLSQVKFNWTLGGGIYTSSPGADNYINLRDGSYDTLYPGQILAESECYDAYFEVWVNRDSNAYDNTRQYYIELTDGSSNTASTPTDRELLVEHLISQNRNGVDQVSYGTAGFSGPFTDVAAGGTMNLFVGETYYIRMDGHTATQGYNQLEDFITMPNTIFQVEQVQSHYSADSSTFVANSNNKLYADACLWDPNLSSDTYRSCIGSDGKAGGTIYTTYKVKIIGGAGTTQQLSNLIYDFSGSSYHYNADMTSSSVYASISSPLSITKSFNFATIQSGAGNSSTLTITISNASTSAVSNVSLNDTFPSGMTYVPTTSNSCGGTLTTSPNTAVSLSGGTVPASGNCTIVVVVTAPTTGSYRNTTDHLFQDGGDTGQFASAVLTVQDSGTGTGFCASSQNVAGWQFSSGSTIPPDQTIGSQTGVPTISGTWYTSGGYPTAAASSGLTTSINNKGFSGYSWSMYGWPSSGATQYIDFTINTIGVSNLQMSWYSSYSGANAPTSENLSYYDGSSWHNNVHTVTTFVKNFGSGTIQQTYTVPAGTLNSSGNTIFRFAVNSADISSQYDWAVDELMFTGTYCGPATQPTVTKSFSPTTIGAGGTSTLTLTLSNSNTTALTGASITDTFPAGMTYQSTTSNSCGGTLYDDTGAALAADAGGIQLTGGTIPASGSCSVVVVVQADTAGVYDNTTGFISTTESGVNTNPYGTSPQGAGWAALTVLAPPVISKAFSPDSIYTDGTSTLTFTITNPNAGSALSSVAFTDPLPSLSSPARQIQVASSPNSSTSGCGSPTFTPSANDTTLSFSGGTIAAGGTCVVKVDVSVNPSDSSGVGTYDNLIDGNNGSSIVSTVIGGATYYGNTTEAILGVKTTTPDVDIRKEISTSSSGPWSQSVQVAPGSNVYYRLTVENTGDVPLTPFTVSDPTVDTSGCSWPTHLAVGTPTVDPSASCLLGPITAASSGTHNNTATVTAYYDDGGTPTEITPNPTSSASYTVTTLNLVKSVTAGDPFSLAGDTLDYQYRITNNGEASLNFPAVVTDSMIASADILCPGTDTSGNNNASLDPGEYVDCTGTYTVTAYDVLVGSVTNIARATLDGVTSNTDSKTVYKNQEDLTVSIVNDTSGLASASVPFNWTMTALNQGPVDATFSSGQVILQATLPSSGASYGSLVMGASNNISGTGTISCSITTNILTCTASGGSVTFGATNGSFAVSVPTTPTALGSLVATVTVDPDNHIAESNEGNNSDANSVAVPVTTPVTLSYFRAQRKGKVVNFNWSTATETGNIGFNLYAESGGQKTILNTELISSQVIDSLERQDYTYSVVTKENMFYIEDVSVYGETKLHGPFKLGQPYGAKLEAEQIDWAAVQAEHNAKNDKRQDKLKKDMHVPDVALAARDKNKDKNKNKPPVVTEVPASPVPVDPANLLLTNTVNMKVNQTGLYRVTYEMLRDAGLDLAGISVEKLTVTNRNYMIPVYVYMPGQIETFGIGGYIEFYGEGLDTIYTDTNIYTLQVSSVTAPRVGMISATPTMNLMPALSYTEKLTVNNQKAYVSTPPGSDPWYDTGMQVSKTPKSWNFNIQVNNLADSNAASTLELVVWGYSSALYVTPDHHMLVNLNGVTLANETFDGMVVRTLNLTIPPGTLHEGANTLQITLPGDTGAYSDAILFDRYTLTYQRLFNTQDGQLVFTSTGEVLAVTDLPDANVVVYRVSDGDFLRLTDIQLQAVDTTYTATFAGTEQLDKYLVTTPDNILTPVLEASQPMVNLDKPAEYLIISHPDFISGLDPLVEVKQAQGLTVSVVNVMSLYDQYNYSIFDPQAIKSYIAYAVENLGTKYVLLVGGDTYDYRNYLGKNSISFIPSMYVSTGSIANFIPSDPAYADLNGDNIPDLPIGRFPVRTAAELDLMINKTLTYASKSYDRTSFMATDVTSSSVSFKIIGEQLASTLPVDWFNTTVNMDDVGVSAAKVDLLAAMNSGTALVTYVGHSGPTSWSFSNLFSTTDARNLTNAGKPFVVVQWGCWNTYYINPVNNYLVQDLLISGDKGAAVVMGATTLADSESERLLGQLLMPRLATPGTSVGEALHEAKIALAKDHPELLDMLLGFSLMGDPSLLVQP